MHTSTKVKNIYGNMKIVTQPGKSMRSGTQICHEARTHN